MAVMAAILNICRKFVRTRTKSDRDMGFSLLASAYVVYLSILKLEVYDIQMAAVTPYVKWAQRQISNFLKNSPILTKLNMYVHMGDPSDVTLLSFS